MSTVSEVISQPDSASLETGTQSSRLLNIMQQSVRRRLFRTLSELRHGCLEISDSLGSQLLGDSDRTDVCQIVVSDPRFYTLLMTDGSLGFADAWIRGFWSTNDLTGLLQIFSRNLDVLSGSEGWLANVAMQFRRIAGRLTDNTLSGSRRNIAAHYDLSNEFFDLFLDPTMMYSSAWFESQDSTLEEASTAKLEKICQKLQLTADHRVVEIGTGWGGFALHATQNHGCHVTTTTISAKQHQRAQQRFSAAGIDDQVNLLDSDYRDLEGTYDRLVSIEMVEAVGERWLPTYFRKCGELLRPGGRFAIQAIVMPESRYDSYRRRKDFIQEYIFPGGFLPTVTTMQSAVAHQTNLSLESVEDMSLHYARTLNCWRERFHQRLDDIRSLGFDDEFIRTWDYYFAYCEAAFREHAVRVVQMVWEKPEF